MNSTHESKMNGGRIPFSPTTVTSRHLNRVKAGEPVKTHNNLKKSLLSKSGQKYALLASGALVRV